MTDANLKKLHITVMYISEDTQYNHIMQFLVPFRRITFLIGE